MSVSESEAIGHGHGHGHGHDSGDRARVTGRGRRLLVRVVAAVALVTALPFTLLGIYSLTLTTPLLSGESTDTGAEPGDSLRVVDRTGVVLREVRASDGMRAQRLELAEFGERLPLAMLAAEDKRFYSHRGIDAVALARAGWDGASEGRFVSGASTITQQLARNLTGEPRTAAGKVRVMALALRLEAAYAKDEILEAYLNRVAFGPNVRGAAAAAELYFGKPCAELSLAESAAIAGIVRGPSLYDPTRRPGHLSRRRDRVLDRMLEAGFATEEEVTRAKGEPLVLSPRFSPASAPHFVAALVAGKLGVLPPPNGTTLETTLLSDLQAEALVAARRAVDALEDQGVTAASAVVLDNPTGEILAYVGSPDATDVDRLGGNDGVVALRQPGSALKPFVYELAMEKLDLVPSSLLPDVDTSFPGPDGASFRPKNYDDTFHGPVLLRDALGSSFNVPAVHVAERLGTAAVLERLRAVGLSSLDREAEHYGLAIALGDGEVRLLDLANAYATLARRGVWRPVRATLHGHIAEPKRVLDARSTYLVTHVLADPAARLSSFGDDSVLEMPFEAAVKTGTSKGYRDNFAVGFTPEITVAVWVGNFDGSPMRGVSGVTGAGPLLREILIAAARHRRPTPFDPPDAIEEITVCALSGHRAGPDCPHSRLDIIPEGHDHPTCSMHRRIAIDRVTGERAGEACAPSTVEERVFEILPSIYADWARTTGRPLAPSRFSARCPGQTTLASVTSDAPRILYPRDGARFFVEPSGRRPSIRVRVTGTGAALSIDGRPIADPVIVLSPGKHVIAVRGAGGAGDEVEITVE